MNWKTTAIALAGLTALSVWAQDDNPFAQYREMFGDDNPAELVEFEGEILWAEARGPNNVSLEQCDLGLGPGVVEGAYAQLPRHFEDADAVMDLEMRLVYCMEKSRVLTAMNWWSSRFPSRANRRRRWKP